MMAPVQVLKQPRNIVEQRAYALLASYACKAASTPIPARCRAANSSALRSRALWL